MQLKTARMRLKQKCGQQGVGSNDADVEIYVAAFERNYANVESMQCSEHHCNEAYVEKREANIIKKTIRICSSKLYLEM